MPQQSRTLEYLDWAMEKVDEIEAATVSLEKVVMALSRVARAKTEAEAAAIGDVSNNTCTPSDKDWAELELACGDFIARIRDYANIMRQIMIKDCTNIMRQVLIDSTEAEYWPSFQEPALMLMSASDVIDQARNKIDDVIQQLNGEIEKAETKPADAFTVDDQPGEAVKGDFE